MRKFSNVKDDWYVRRVGSNIRFLPWRFRFILFIFIMIIVVLMVRMYYLTFVERPFLLLQGNMRSLRTKLVPAYRGMIMDRNGEPLAVSTPVDSIWINPQDFPANLHSMELLSNFLGIPISHINALLNRDPNREFLYIRRGISPQIAERVDQLSIPGVYLEREYRRYYPEAEDAVQVVGFTNIDDHGQEGLELLYDKWLSGIPGSERIIKDRYGHIVAIISDIQPARPGNDLILSIDHRIQFLAYRVLKESIQQFEATTGSVVVLNPKTGEVLAMANSPSFNPNQRSAHDYGQFRNRAVTDMFEPGSTMKVFSIASALDSGKFKPNTLIDTSPGWMMIGRNRVHDEEFNHGVLTVTQVLQKSSNVGVAKMTISLPAEHFLDLLKRVGFGDRTRSGFPGESPGRLVYHAKWQPFDLATMAFGYGISVTPLQLAQAYGVIANGGLKCPVTFVKLDKTPNCQRVMDRHIADEMLTMLETVVQSGTGTLAVVPGYRIAGKTGTARIAIPHGYDSHRHVSSFVGIAPVSNPQLIVAVIIRDPHHRYFGGSVAAPAFSKIMSGALNILNIPPDSTQKTK